MTNRLPERPTIVRPPSRRTIEGVTQFTVDIVRQLTELFTTVNARANAAIMQDGSEVMSGPLVLNSYTVATVPTAADWTAGVIYVSDETGGAIPAFSDGTNWRRMTDRAIVS